MQTTLEIIIDNSNSMGYPKGLLEVPESYLLKDGSTRMSLVKKILVNDLLPMLDFVSDIRITTFHSAHPSGEFKSNIIYDGKFDFHTLVNKVNSITDPKRTGGTPITYAVSNAITLMHILKKNYQDKKVILITDGHETGVNDYSVKVNELLKELNFKCTIFIVGIALSEEARKKSEKLASSNNGVLLDLGNDIDYNSPQIKSGLLKFQEKLLLNTISNQQHRIEIDELEAVQVEHDEKKESNPLDKVTILEKNVADNNRMLGLLSKQIAILQASIDNQNTTSNEVVEIIENVELNELIRSKSESFVYNHLKHKYGDTVLWANEKGESGLSYDFKIKPSELTDSKELIVECKGTSSSDYQFYLTKNEWELFLKNSDNYHIYFVFNALNTPRIMMINDFMNDISSGRIVPYSPKNIKLKAGRILFTILQPENYWI